MNWDPVAPWYRWLEYAAFGKFLERCRNFYLPQLTGARRVLMIGEGDGRFLRAFAAAALSEIDYLDGSAAMLAIARRRCGTSSVRYFHRDIEREFPPGSGYDLIVAHFFLDCFDDRQLLGVVSKIADVAAPGVRLLVSEFRPAGSGFWKHVTAGIIRLLYLFFRWTAGLQVRRLPPYGATLEANGFVLERQHIFLKGLLVSQIWRR